MDYEIIVPLETHYGRPSRNCIIYSKEVIEEMLNSEHFKELEKNNCLFITRGFPENGIVDPSDVVGRVNSLDIENGISNISLNKEIYKEIYLHHERYDNMTLGMNYLGTVDNYEVSYMKILSFSLIDNKGNFLLE